MESVFGATEMACLFEPEVTPYVNALKKYRSHKNVLIFNFGLSTEINKFSFSGEYSFYLEGSHSELLSTPANKNPRPRGAGYSEQPWLKI